MTLPLTMVGAAPCGTSGVRDYSRVLARELGNRGLEVTEAWVENDGGKLCRAISSSTALLMLAVALPRPRHILWHYSPVPYSFRGLPGPGVLLGRILRRRGSHVVTILHELAYSRSNGVTPVSRRVQSWAQHAALAIVLWGSDRIVVTTQHRLGQLAELGYTEPMVHLIPVFATVPIVDLQPAANPLVTQHGALTVGVPAYSGDGTRPDVMLRAVSLLGPDRLRLLLIGAPGPDSPAGQEWRRLAHVFGVDSCLTFTGLLEPEEYGRRLAATDLVVLVNEEGPSTRKTSLAGALAHGLPVVSLDGPNRSQTLVDDQAVRVVPPEPAALAAVLLELWDSPRERSTLGAAGRTYYQLHLALDVAADAYCALLADLAAHETGEGFPTSHVSEQSDMGVDDRW
ncbi:MAG: glycosyltransferase [Acidimicrobiales bacterium]